MALVWKTSLAGETLLYLSITNAQLLMTVAEMAELVWEKVGEGQKKKKET